MKKTHVLVFSIVLVWSTFMLSGCMTTGEVKQFGLEGDDTIALNIGETGIAGRVYVTHVNGIATGAQYSAGFLGLGGKAVYVNPLYIKLNGRPIVFTVSCPVVTYSSSGEKIIVYKSTELRLTKLSDLKAGDVLSLRWMYQTQTLCFMDATGNIVQQIIPTFN